MENKKMLKISAVANLLGIGKNTVIREIEDGNLMAYKFRGVYRIPEDALEEYLREREVKKRNV